MEKSLYSLGIDVGSTTVKTVLLDAGGSLLYGNYLRHASKVKETTLLELKEIEERYGDIPLNVSLTGSAGLGLSERAGIPFVQEVQSSYYAIKVLYPNADCAIELGGEDAKIIFITGGLEERMNGQCAGGTGAFIDQMATLLHLTPSEMDELSLRAQKAYPIASRCGVFAKSDIQSLLNSGASKEDVALSIFYAVADQTIAGLAQGREIKGHVLFLGGPLFFLQGLRKAFKDRLHLEEDEAIYPEDASIFVARGAALYSQKAGKVFSLSALIRQLESADVSGQVISGKPLFSSQEEFKTWLKRHEERFAVPRGNLSTYEGKAYLGIDAGSTTTKLVLLGENEEILYQSYASNAGLPLEKIAGEIQKIYDIIGPNCHIVSSAVTGYGEDMIRSSLGVDYGLVETVAHFRAAKHFCPNVDFVIDIGGQDIKCFKVHGGAIDSIMLNEACSSGCGSFLQTFAASLGYEVEDFAKAGYYAPNPVELGSRCTVFMNSSVKQAQREGASVADISAGLSRSVVKNALYKVIRVRSAEELGENIVCQGGTFLNNAVLRCFEQEIGKEVIRLPISGLMGAYGAALYAKEQGGLVGLNSKEALGEFSYTSRHVTCHGCTAHCSLSMLRFPNGKTFLSGNKCDKPEGKSGGDDSLDIYAYKRKRLEERLPQPDYPCAKVGLPRALCMYEQLPLWDAFFKKLGFETVVSPYSNRALYRDGQKTIPSDTACYPAKLFHGHVDYLIKQGVDFIFYPSESYNVDEKRGDNHFQCPVVAYYGELLRQNDSRLNKKNFLDPFVELPAFSSAVHQLYDSLKRFGVRKSEVKVALQFGLDELQKYREDCKREGERILGEARAKKMPIIVLAGRPYHVDPEINHGIDRLLDRLGVAVLSEDSLRFGLKIRPHVLNQWTYHARLYDCANLCTQNQDMNLVQLVSFGCGVDAVTSDEVRRILEEKGRLYTQIKIDEISNLGAVKIRLRSLLAALEEREDHGSRN